jgi:hypothetical protein
MISGKRMNLAQKRRRAHLPASVGGMHDKFTLHIHTPPQHRAHASLATHNPKNILNNSKTLVKFM